MAALAAVVAAVVIAAVLLFGGVADSKYKVEATFINAAQLVKGNPVQVDGVPAGSVDQIKITDAGQARITLTIDDKYAPLRRGTRATIRQSSLSGIANRYVDLDLPDAGSKDEIPDGGALRVDETQTAVDLDQLFNTFDPPTRKALQGFLKGSARQFRGQGRAANRGFRYLNPSLSTASRFFDELTRDTPLLERFLVDSAKLVTALADRRDDLAALIGNLNDTTRALGNQKTALAESIERLPGFMRTSNTTFVNLRAALNDVDPLVDASKPVARRLRPFLPELRRLVRDGRPTIRDLNQIVRRSGSSNDLTELVRSNTPLASEALDTKERSLSPSGNAVSVGNVRGAFPESTQALKDSTPIIAFGRPYTVDLVGWFDDFSNRGVYDALGGISRVQVYLNAFTAQTGLPIPIAQQPQSFQQLAKLYQFKRCPGAAEAPAADNSNVFTTEEQQELDCVEAHRATSSR